MKNRTLVIIMAAVLLYAGAGFTASCHGQNRTGTEIETGSETGTETITGTATEAETVSPDNDADGVVSHTATEPPHEWTREEMLLAQPMPMSGEERDFVFKHKSVQKLNEWSYDDYKDYVASAIGRQILFGEGQRWIDLRMMLRAQAQFAADFVAGKVKAPQPLPPNLERRKKLQDALTDGEQDMEPGSGGSSSAPGASGGYPGDDGGGEPKSMNLRENLSDEESFLKDAKDLNGADSQMLFKKLKALKEDISVHCKRLDAAEEEAKQKGLEQALENQMNAVLWD